MKKILIVNSSYETMELLETWLERKEYDVKITAELDEVISIVESFKPVVMLVDIAEASIITSIKSDTTLLPVRILFMTGHTGHGRLNMQGADDTIEKPFDLNNLQKKISNLISQAA